MILDYDERVVSYECVPYYTYANGDFCVFKIIHCQSCHQRSILAYSPGEDYEVDRLDRYSFPALPCNRCLESTKHWIYNPTTDWRYSYRVSREWAMALRRYPVDYDNRKILTESQIDKKSLRLLKWRAMAGKKSATNTIEAVRFHKERKAEKVRKAIELNEAKKKRRLLDLATRQAAKESAFMTVRRIEVERAAEEERVAWLKEEHLHLQIMGDEPLFVCAAMPSDRDNVEVVFCEAQRQRGTKRPFVNLQRQEYGDPRMAGAW
jgi:hypothetical protein